MSPHPALGLSQTPVGPTHLPPHHWRSRHLPASAPQGPWPAPWQGWGPVQGLGVRLGSRGPQCWEGGHRKMLSPTNRNRAMLLGFPLTPLGEPPFSGTPHPLTSFIPELEDPLSLNFPILSPNLQGNGGPDGAGLLEVTSQTGSRHPCPSSQCSFHFLGSVSVSLHLSSTPLSPSLPWKQDTFSDSSLEAEISTGLDASSQGSESFQGAFCHLGREGVWEGPRGSSCPSPPGPVQATQPSPPTPRRPRPVGVFVHTLTLAGVKPH